MATFPQVKRLHLNERICQWVFSAAPSSSSPPLYLVRLYTRNKRGTKQSAAVLLLAACGALAERPFNTMPGYRTHACMQVGGLFNRLLGGGPERQREREGGGPHSLFRCRYCNDEKKIAWTSADDERHACRTIDYRTDRSAFFLSSPHGASKARRARKRKANRETRAPFTSFTLFYPRHNAPCE